MNRASAKFLPFHVPLIEEDDIRAVRDAMLSGWITSGPKSVRFEEDFARYVGIEHAVAVNSGTAALHLALEAIGVREDDEVIVPTLTFAATAEAVVYCRARPILVDCEPDTFNLDPKQVQRAITRRTRAIIPVHFAGHPCDMARLLEIAGKHNLMVVEDAAHALSARYRGKMAGTLGDIACFSFYATKNITTGEGGMATTNRSDWAERMRMMRLHGIGRDAWKRYAAESSWRYEILAPGFKYNLSDMQAALGVSQLAKCESMWSRRSFLAQRYSDSLGLLDEFEVPVPRQDVQHAWHLYVLRVRRGALSIHRDRVIEELKERGVGSSVHFIPLHLHPYYKQEWGYREGDFPVAEDYFNRSISLPIYPAMSDADQERVIEALKDIAILHRRTGTSAFPTSEHEMARESAERPAWRGNHAASAKGAQPKAGRRRMVKQGRPRGEWYRRSGKRLFDVAGAVTGLVVALPLLVFCAIAVRLSSPGPILFRQWRIGRRGRPFELLKFRTMRVTETGPRITTAGDKRVTGAGRWLRRWKLDEIPQLVNVLKGEMSLVGPRPEVPEYAANYNQGQRRILEAKPGITSPASLAFIDEETVLSCRQDCERFYLRDLLPQKLETDLAYSRAISLSTDLRILLATAQRLLLPVKPKACTAPLPRRTLSGKVESARLRRIGVEDLLGRSSVVTSEFGPYAREIYEGKRILVTGAGGSIGSELCRQLLLLRPSLLAVLDKDENSIYELENELRLRDSKARVQSHVADLKLRERVAAVFGETRPQVVLHAAAHKHVPLMELNPCEAVLNNVMGLKHALEACCESGVERFVFISSDKAVNPTSVMGATKRVGEKLLSIYTAGKSMRAASVRFGNVIGSRGSVIPLFQKQIEAGGPITVTHPDMARFFMSIPEAAQLVLRAGSLAKRNEIFVLEMGSPRRMLDLARRMIEMAGLEPGRDISVEITGLRPGEKMEEELAGPGEALHRTSFEKVLEISPAQWTEERFISQVERIIELARRGDKNEIVRQLAAMQLGYRPTGDFGYRAMEAARANKAIAEPVAFAAH